MARLFVGTFLQAREQEQLALLPAQYPQLSALINRQIRWVKPKKLHMTWIFLGEVKEAQIDSVRLKLEECLSDFRSQPRNGNSGLSLQFDKLDFWPNKKEPRNIVLCAGPDSGQDFARLAADIRGSLRAFADSNKKEKFRPHVTLLRVDRHPLQSSIIPSADSWAQFAQAMTDAANQVTPLPLPLARIDLIRSHLGQASDEYESLCSLATSAF